MFGELENNQYNTRFPCPRKETYRREFLQYVMKVKISAKFHQTFKKTFSEEGFYNEQNIKLWILYRFLVATKPKYS